MSGLLHIKRFRQNMLKLFVIYLVVILSTTSVITYSRYITSMESTSYARPAKFNVEITKGDICVAGTTSCKESSGLTKFKPYDKLEYYFSIDTTQLEVSTIVSTVILVDEHYSFINIYEIEDDIASAMNTSDYTINSTRDRITVTRDIEAGIGDVKSYKVRLSYEGSSDANPTYDAINVEFSAIQKD